MIGFLIYSAIGMLTLFLFCIQCLREENAGKSHLKVEDRDKEDETAAALRPFAALFLWPLVLPIVLAYLLFWKPRTAEVAQ